MSARVTAPANQIFSRTALRRAVVGVAVVGAVACGGSDPPGEAVEPGTFLAFETSFRGFRSWEAFAAAVTTASPTARTSRGVARRI